MGLGALAAGTLPPESWSPGLLFSHPVGSAGNRLPGMPAEIFLAELAAASFLGPGANGARQRNAVLPIPCLRACSTRSGQPGGGTVF